MTLYFNNYVCTNGFPSEEYYIVGDRLDCLPSFALVLWHQTKGKHFHDYNEILINSIYTGAITSEITAALTETHSGISFGTKSFYHLQCESCNDLVKAPILGKIFYPKQFLINENKDLREKYLLDSFDNIHLKNKFKLMSEEFRFGCFTSVFPTFTYSKEEFLRSMLENSKEFIIK